jgi:hypothetical protein
MKKNIIGIFILLTLLSSILIYAENKTNSLDLTSNPEEIKEDLISTGQDTSSSFKQIFSNPLEIPESISFLPKILFGATDTISISEFIIYSAIWLLLLLIINNLIKTIPELDKITAIIISTIILLLGSTVGGIQKGSEIWINFLGSISRIEKINSWAVSIGIIVLIGLFILTKYFSKTLSELTKLNKAKEQGIKAAYSTRILNAQAR